MGVNGEPEPSMVSSRGSNSATELSRRTDRTSYSVPDDGRAITIQTNNRSRRRKDPDTASTLSHGTNTSLLIEYFENGKAAGSSSGHRPSVRVKVTPSAAKRHHVKPAADGQGLQISDVGSRSDSRRPSHTHRISLGPHNHASNEDRIVLGERSRSYSGDYSTLSSYTSAAEDSNLSHATLNVTVIREAGSPGSTQESPRPMDSTEMSYENRRRRTRTGSRSRNPPIDDYYEGPNTSSRKGMRSRSVSRESDISLEESTPRARKLGRRKSRSLSRERITMSQREKDLIERGVRAELEKLSLPKSGKTRSKSRPKMYEESLKPPRVRSRSRNREEVDEITAEKMRHRRKVSQMDDTHSVRSTSGGSTITNNPALIEFIQDTIKRLVLPEIEEIKANQQHKKGSEGLAPLNVHESLKGRPGPGRATSMPDVGKPMVVLSPDIDKGQGQGYIIAGSRKEIDRESDVSNSRRGYRSRSPLHSEHDGEGVSLVSMQSGFDEVTLEMPDGPFRSDTPGTNAGTRASILTAKSGFPPYPKSSTPPPRSELELPELSEINLESGVGGSSTILSGRTDARSGMTKSVVSKAAPGAPSIASLNMETELDDDGVSGVSTATRQAPTTVRPGYSELSFRTMSVDGSTVLAKERKDKSRRRKGVEDLSDIKEGSVDDASSVRGGLSAVNLFFAEQREREQEKALLNPSLQDMSFEVRHVSTIVENDFEPRQLDKVGGQQVFALGANPSMRSTPVAAHSVQASVLDPSNLDVVSNVSAPQMTANALPSANSPLPEIGHIHDEDEDINTNPSIIQGPIGHGPGNWDFDHPQPSHDLGIDDGLSIGEGTARDYGVNGPAVHPSSHGAATPPPLKDEGYISAANPMGSPGTITPVRGIEDILSDGDEFSPYRGHKRNAFGSGNSHGMPSPLYDSATGRGIDRIQSRDIVALMEHLTVRDAQRNARDTEILVTLVRSAAEMRNSFEDMRKQLESQERNIISEVDQNTERSVQKVIQGPRPAPPSAPRRPRYQRSDEDAEDEGSAKKRSVFKRALKGLSMRSTNDLQRIEEMLCTLLDDVEGLKDGQNFYQHSLMQSQSIGTFENMKSVQDSQEVPLNNSIAGNSGLHSAGPSRQPSGKLYQGDGPRQSTHISPINEDEVLATPQRETRGASLPLDTPPDTKVPLASASVGNTPTKSSDKDKPNKRESGSSSIFPKISRWSETTASSGLRNFLSKGKKEPDGSEGSRSQSDFNFWEVNHQQEQTHESPFASEGQLTERARSPLLPPSSRDTDAPVKESNRISLDIHHPQPRPAYNHRLEAQAQQLTTEGSILPNSPNNNSVSSLGNYPPIGPGGFQNGKLLSPLAQDAYNQHQQQLSPNGPPRPPKIKEDAVEDPTSPPRAEKKEKKRRDREEKGEKGHRPKKERTEEEKRKRRAEKREKKSRDVLSPDSELPSMSGRTPSSARLNGPRPLSSNSNKENSRRHRHTSSQSTNDTFGGNGITFDSYGVHR